MNDMTEEQFNDHIEVFTQPPKSIEAILTDMRDSEWYKTVVGADTLQRIRNASIPPFTGETIDQWVERVFTTLLDEMVRRVEEHRGFTVNGSMEIMDAWNASKDDDIAIINSFRKSV